MPVRYVNSDGTEKWQPEVAGLRLYGWTYLSLSGSSWRLPDARWVPEAGMLHGPRLYRWRKATRIERRRCRKQARSVFVEVV
jgi:hypothetical protein